MGLLRQILSALHQLLQKWDDVDCQLIRVNTNLSTIEGELDKVNKHLETLIKDEESAHDVVSLAVRVDPPTKQ